MNLRALGMAAALLAIGFAAGAWWMDARRAVEIAELEAAASRSMVADLAALSGAVPGPALPGPQAAPVVAPPPAAPAKERAATPVVIERPDMYPLGIDPTSMSHADYNRAIVERFANEAPDLEWQRTTEGKLTDHFYRGNPLGEGATLESVECKATLCKLVARSREQDPEKVLGPRSFLWNDMMAFSIQTNRPSGDAPLDVVMWLTPSTAGKGGRP
jgi:hypothetical protein